MSTQKQTVSLNPGETKSVPFTFTPMETGVYNVSVDGLSGSFEAILVPVPQTGFISGHVFVAGGTTPVVGATVIVDDIVVATTNTAGGYIIELTVGNHVVTISAAGYNAPTPRTIMVLNGQYADGNFTLTPEMTGYSLIDRVLGGIIGGYASYIYPVWYNVTGSVGAQAYVERYGQSHSVSWRWGATTLKFPHGTVKNVYVSNGRFYDVSTGTPTVLNQAGQYYVRMQLESTMDGTNWYVSDDKTIKLCYLS
jgi:hypothetical protein